VLGDEAGEPLAFGGVPSGSVSLRSWGELVAGQLGAGSCALPEAAAGPGRAEQSPNAQRLLIPLPGHGERGQRELQGAVGAQTRPPAPHQPAAAPVHGAGRLPGDGAPRPQCGGAQGVSPGEDVSAPGQVRAGGTLGW